MNDPARAALGTEQRAWLFESLGEPVAVELINTSLASQNLDDKMGWEPRTASVPLEAEIVEQFPHIKYLDLDSHGYNVVDLTPERVLVKWWLVDTVLAPSGGERLGAAYRVNAGRARLVPAE